MKQIEEQSNQSYTLELQAISNRVQILAQQHKDDAIKLLNILRVLEQLHSEISDELFQPALPNTRHGLFDLLRNIEANGGWPYIYRIGLNELCKNLMISSGNTEMADRDLGGGAEIHQWKDNDEDSQR